MTEYSHHTSKHIGLRAMLMALFVAFVCGYIGWMQCDALAQTQHLLSNGHTHYNRVVGTLVITAITIAMQVFSSKTASIPARLYALTYIPSAIFLCVLTDLIPYYTSSKFIVYIIVFIALIVICFATIKHSRQRSVHFGEPKPLLCFNLAILSVIMIATGIIGNTQSVSHYEMKTERYLQEGKPDLALKVGTKETSRRLTITRAYALSLKGKLNEQLFTYPIPSRQQTLLPQLSDSLKMVLPPLQIYHWLGVTPPTILGTTPEQFLKAIATQPSLTRTHPQIYDYLIATLLVNKHIDKFANTVKNIAPPLQKHTREALVLYQHIRTTPVITINDNLTETNYADFMAIRKSAIQDAAKKQKLREQYGDTYWWYYYYI